MTNSKHWSKWFWLVGVCLCGLAVAAAQTPETARTSKKVQVAGTKQWTDTGIDVAAGERVLVVAQGEIRYLSKLAGPEGLPRDWRDLLRSLPVNAAGGGTLIGRIGDAPAVAFAIGAKKEVTVNRGGRLFLGLNQGEKEAGEGNFEAQVDVFAASAGGAPAATAALPAAAPAAEAKISPDILQQIPRRIGDKEGNPGDMVNFFIIGPREKLTSTFQAAGWNQADKTKTEAVVNALLSSLQKNTYLALPMSELYLFGRVQDFGYEHAEPVQMVAQRHHLRIWKAAMQVDGQDLWVGAATHDIGFERDQRNNGVTHKIDPNIDLEREYVGETLNSTGLLGAVSHVLPADPLTEAHTATGGTFHSDGRILVMQLK
jgi:hypothetical protein